MCNINGEVVGINCMKTAQGTGIGFAIPMDTASQVIEQLLHNGRVVRPYVGMRMVNVSDASSVQGGVMVVQVASDSPAQTAGAQPGDIIKKFDGMCCCCLFITA